jgi:hypothetical protein
MATRTESLSQTERDLNKYATGKAYTLMRDVRQAADIAGLSAANAGACVGALFLRLAAHIAVTAGHDKLTFIRWCLDCFDLASEDDAKHRSQPKESDHDKLET